MESTSYIGWDLISYDADYPLNIIFENIKAICNSFATSQADMNNMNKEIKEICIASIQYMKFDGRIYLWHL